MASWLSMRSGRPSAENVRPYIEWQWAAAITSGRAAWRPEWMAKAAVFTGWSPITTAPVSLTQIRSETVMYLKFFPNGFTQK